MGLVTIKKKTLEKKENSQRNTAISQPLLKKLYTQDNDKQDEIIDVSPIIDLSTPNYITKSIVESVSQERKNTSNLFSQTMQFMQEQWKSQMITQEKMFNKIMESNERITELANKQLDTFNNLKDDTN